MEFPTQAIIQNYNIPPTYEESLQHDLETAQQNINRNMVKYLLGNGAIIVHEYSGPDIPDGHKIKELLLKYGNPKIKLGPCTIDIINKKNLSMMS